MPDNNVESKSTPRPKPFPWTRQEAHDYVVAHTEPELEKGSWAFQLLLRLLLPPLRAMSWKTADWFGGVVGRLLARLRIRRSVALTNLDIAFGDSKTAAEKQAIYRACMINLGRHALDYVRTPQMDEEYWANFPIENEHLLTETYNRGKGVILIGGHIGVWDFAGCRASIGGYPISIVSKRQSNADIERLVRNARLDANLGTILHKNSMKRILDGFKRGEGIIMAVDQNMKLDQGIFVDWLGRQASTVKSNAWVARETGAAVLVGYAFRTGPGRCKLVMTEEVPWEPHPEDPEEELRINTQNQANAVAKVIRENPELWLWVHRRYKVQPAGVPSPYKD
jgi:KDO2-lipid IV(A) lauroyltransferase